jgi:hypothetical protein
MYAPNQAKPPTHSESAMRRLIFGLLAVFGVLLLTVPSASAQGVSPSQMFGCNQSAQYDASTSGDTKLVTGVAGKQIYVCGYVFWSNSTANVKLEYGTGGTCGTGTHAITPAIEFTAQTGIVDHLPVYTGLPPAPASNDVCINSSQAVAVQGIVYYTQF